MTTDITTSIVDCTDEPAKANLRSSLFALRIPRGSAARQLRSSLFALRSSARQLRSSLFALRIPRGSAARQLRSSLFALRSFDEGKGRIAAFTLVELLVVIAIIGILSSLLGAAIINANHTANKVRAENNGQLLRSAIVEYWHDFGKWPVDGNVIKEKLSDANVSKTRSGSTVVGSDLARGTLSYTMSFYEDNNEVVKHLLDARLPNGSKKTYLNLKGFVTPVETGIAANDYPIEDTVDAYLAYSGDQGALSDNINATEKTVTNRKDPVLLFRTQMYKCPDCGAITRSKACPNNSDSWAKEHAVNGGKVCDFYANNNYRRPLRARDRTFGAKPYTITFDLNDNTVAVSAD